MEVDYKREKLKAWESVEIIRPQNDKAQIKKKWWEWRSILMIETIGFGDWSEVEAGDEEAKRFLAFLPVG